jgi:transcriptional regulator with XRE-family HTH domain
MEFLAKRLRNNGKRRHAEIARLLVAVRLKTGWRKEVVAHSLGCRQSDLSRWESGEKRLNIVEVKNLAALCEFTLPDFFTIGMAIHSCHAQTDASEFRKRALEEKNRLAQLRETCRQKKGRD